MTSAAIDKIPPQPLPKAYHILPESIDFIIPGFRSFYTPGDKTLALRQRDCEEWFNEFVDKLLAACGKYYLPVCRMSDGEFLFLLGYQPPNLRLSLKERAKQRINRFLQRLYCGWRFNAYTAGSGLFYSSGEYSYLEWQKAKKPYTDWLKKISEQGILALHLNYGRIPFQEYYFPALGRWMDRHSIKLTDYNYVPFYFVYAALTGPRRTDLLKGRRVLVVNSAEGEKHRQVEDGLRKEGIAKIFWHPISRMRSLYDRIDVTPFIGKVDLAVVGAGIGKPNIMIQLEPLQVPCIDAGFVFEVWANPENKRKRAVCAPDEEWKERKENNP